MMPVTTATPLNSISQAFGDGPWDVRKTSWRQAGKIYNITIPQS
jgi:hypothetical protein